MKLKKAIPYDIHIRPSANNGFIVKVGCGEFVAATTEQLMIGLDEFLHNVDKFVEEYNDRVTGEEVTSDRTVGESAEVSSPRGGPDTTARVPRR